MSSVMNLRSGNSCCKEWGLKPSRTTADVVSILRRSLSLTTNLLLFSHHPNALPDVYSYSSPTAQAPLSRCVEHHSSLASPLSFLLRSAAGSLCQSQA